MIPRSSDITKQDYLYIFYFGLLIDVLRGKFFSCSTRRCGLSGGDCDRITERCDEVGWHFYIICLSSLTN